MKRERYLILLPGYWESKLRSSRTSMNFNSVYSKFSFLGGSYWAQLQIRLGASEISEPVEELITARNWQCV